MQKLHGFKTLKLKARDIQHLNYAKQLEDLAVRAPNVPRETLSQLLSFSHTMLTEESAALGLADFPIDNLISSITTLNAVPELTTIEFINRFYPYKLFLPLDGQKSVEDTMQSFQISSSTSSAKHATIESISHSSQVPHTVQVSQYI